MIYYPVVKVLSMIVKLRRILPALLAFSLAFTMVCSSGLASKAGKGHPIPLQQLSGYHCTALAPAGWSIAGGRQEGDSLDVARSDRKAAAGYLIMGVTSQMRQFYPAYATPTSTVMTNLATVLGARVTLGAQRQAYGYTIVSWQSSKVLGLTLYRVFALPGDPQGFIIAMRSGAAAPSEWKRSFKQAVGVATSVRCAVQLVAHTTGSSDAQRRARDESDQASSYNKELGMEYAHSATTGENFWVSSSTDMQNGPEGRGFYNNGQKLVLGRSP